jgi:UDP-N-acetylmuramate: L-alanyl-gamma-D-glutamyl-meso-diaminopimelate ligase
LGGGSDFIIEGDEYETAFFDRGPKFLHYHPDDLVITSLEFDHADIYADLPAISLQFRRLVNLVPRGGRVVAWGESAEVMACTAKAFCRVETFGLSPEMDWFAGDIEWSDQATQFRVVNAGREVARIRMPIAGRHNVLNAVAATAVAVGRGIAPKAIEEALRTFQSVRRRMETKGESAGVLVVEDFAHHPTAIGVTIDAARTRWPGRRMWAVFEPRSNSMRRKVFQDILPDAFQRADAVVIGGVDRAQLLSDSERIDPSKIAEDLRARGKNARAFSSATEIAQYLGTETAKGDLVLVMSNGSFDGLCGKLLGQLEKRGQ